MYIKTRKQAQTAAAIAARYGYEIPATAWVGRYATNTLNDYTTSRNKNRATIEREIVAALKARR